MASDTSGNLVGGHPGNSLFDTVVAQDYEKLIELYCTNAKNAVGTYLTMRNRWAQQQDHYGKSGMLESLV